MQTVTRVALGVFIGMWAFMLSIVLMLRIFGTAILGLVF